MADDTRDDRPKKDEPDLTQDQFGILDTLSSENIEDTIPSQGARGRDGSEDASAVTTEHVGRYRYSAKEIGRGGLGRVLSAFDDHLGREVAVKELLPDRRPSSVHGADSGTETAEALARFLREARVTAQLEHPNIVPLYELGRRPNESLYYTMKYVRGRTLKKALAEAEDLGERQRLLPHFVDLCNAIAYAHSRGVIHRDIKPDNVMIGEFGETVVLDWGVAKARGTEDIRGRELARAIQLMQAESSTLPGAAFGTPAYMAPEQADGRIDDVDERSDVWSLGVVLYQIATGKLPIIADNIAALMINVARARWTPVQEAAPNTPPELAAIIAHCLEKEPSDRYQSAKDLAEEIGAYRSGSRVEVYTYSSIELLKRFLEQHRAAVVVSMIAFVALLAVIGGAYVRLLGERDRAVAAEMGSKKSLADALVEKGKILATEKQWIGVSVLAAGALKQAEHPDARGLLSMAEGKWRPEISWQQRTYAGCAAIAKNPIKDEVACGTSLGVELWKASTGEAIPRLEHKRGWIHSLAYSSDGERLAGGSDGEIIVWSNGAAVSRFVGHVGAVLGLAYCGTTLSSAGDDGTVRLYGDGSITWQGTGAVEHIACSDGVLWFSDSTGNLHRHTPTDARTFPTSEAHGGEIVALAAADGTVATFGANRALARWTEGARHIVAPGLFATVTRLEIAGDMIFGVTEDGNVLRFDGNDLDGRFRAHESRIRAFAVSHDDASIFTAGDDRVVRAFRASEKARPLRLRVEHPVRALAVAPDGKALAIATDRELHTFEATSGDPIETVALPPVEERLAVSSSWARLATSEGNDVLLLDSEAGQRAQLRGHDAPITAVAFAGDLLISGSKDKTVRVWPKGALTPSITLKEGGEKISAVAGTEAGDMFAASGDGQITVWKGKEPRLHHQIAIDGTIRAIAFSGDGKLIAAALGNTLTIWSTKSYEQALNVEAHGAPVTAIAFIGEDVITASEDGSIETWPLGVISERRRTLYSRLAKKFGVRLEGTKVTPRN